MDVELTSERDDGTWTWRAAGAKEPKGVVDAKLLHSGARAGDVVRVEATVELDGISVTSVLPPQDKKRPQPQLLEVLGPPPPPPSPPAAHPGDQGSGRSSARPRRGESDGRGQRGTAPTDGPKDPRAAQRARGRAQGQSRGPRAERAQGERGEGERRPRRTGSPAAPAAKRSSATRLSPGNAHRAAALAALPEEQRPVAEQVLRGGIPAVRQAVEAQNAELRRQGQPEVKAGALVALAEDLLSGLKAAEWRDRAEAAAKSVDDISLRDLRSVVAGADAAARDDETRLLASTLREALERRLREQRQRWLQEITSALEEGRLVRALRLASRPPDPGSRIPGEVAVRMSEAAGAAMADDTTPERWLALLEAVAESPVRRSVKPAGLPQEESEHLLGAARQACGRVPALAPLLGIDMPPPPGPPRRRPQPPPPRRRQPSQPAPEKPAAPEEPTPRGVAGAGQPARAD